MSALVDKSLVVAEPGEPPRYRLLESARAFALEQLAEGETTNTLRRHAKAMLEFMQRVDAANLDGELRTDQYAALVVPELDNLRAAHAWSSSEERGRAGRDRARRALRLADRLRGRVRRVVAAASAPSRRRRDRRLGR